ncbi:MAG: hypothetical protein P4L36_17900 [Holophaga sp.]|nr:hypothetical protein [Holophaga sp.]
MGALALLAFTFLGGPGLVPARAADVAISRVENRTYQAWKLSMGNWAAGMIRIRETGSHNELANLRTEGEGFFLMPGKAVDMEILPTRNCLALQVVFSMPNGASGAASVFISQGNPGDPHTLNINPSPAVHVDRSRYGRAGNGPFVLIN